MMRRTFCPPVRRCTSVGVAIHYRDLESIRIVRRPRRLGLRHANDPEHVAVGIAQYRHAGTGSATDAPLAKQLLQLLAAVTEADPIAGTPALQLEGKTQ